MFQDWIFTRIKTTHQTWVEWPSTHRSTCHPLLTSFTFDNSSSYVFWLRPYLVYDTPWLSWIAQGPNADRLLLTQLCLSLLCCMTFMESSIWQWYGLIHSLSGRSTFTFHESVLISWIPLSNAAEFNMNSERLKHALARLWVCEWCSPILKVMKAGDQKLYEWPYHVHNQLCGEGHPILVWVFLCLCHP